MLNVPATHRRARAQAKREEEQGLAPVKANPTHLRQYTFPVNSDQPFDLNKKIKEHLVDEFAAKYAESLGISPNPDIVNHVKRHIPLRSCEVKVGFKQRGFLKDEITVRPKSPQAKAKESTVTQHPFNAQDMFDMAVADRNFSTDVDAVFSKKQETTKRPNFESLEDDKIAPLNLSDIKNSYVYPFNVESYKAQTMREKQEQLHREGVALLNGEDLKKSKNKWTGAATARAPRTGRRASSGQSSRPSSSGPSRRPGASEKIMFLTDFVDEVQLQVEFQGPIRVKLEMARRIVLGYSKAFPYGELRSRLGEEDIQSAQEILRKDEFAGMVRHLCKLCFWSLMWHNMKDKSMLKPTPESEAMRRQKGLFMLICKAWDDTVKPLRRKRSTTVLIIPVLLLGVRTACAEVMKLVYKNYCRTDEGKSALSSLDKIIVALLDPDEFYNMSVLESSADALRRVINHRGASGRRAAVDKYFTVSPMMRTMLGNASSGKARYILNNDQTRPKTAKNKTLKFEGLWKEVTRRNFPRSMGLSLRKCILEGQEDTGALDNISADEASSEEEMDAIGGETTVEYSVKE